MRLVQIKLAISHSSYTTQSFVFLSLKSTNVGGYSDELPNKKTLFKHKKTVPESRLFFNATMFFFYGGFKFFLFCSEIWNFSKAFINSLFFVDEFSGIKHGLVFEWCNEDFILTFSKPKWQINWIIHYKN